MPFLQVKRPVSTRLLGLDPSGTCRPRLGTPLRMGPVHNNENPR